uniref:F-box domain-containing protein n=1 Tax=Leersia perrieri TaxID=77586 RepID=A0A0D9VEY1_9ORYZ
MAAVLGNDDLLEEILLRLGFPTTLVHAALVCKRWLRIIAYEPSSRNAATGASSELIFLQASCSSASSARCIRRGRQPFSHFPGEIVPRERGQTLHASSTLLEEDVGDDSSYTMVFLRKDQEVFAETLCVKDGILDRENVRKSAPVAIQESS